MIEINLLPEDLRVDERPITGARILLFVGIPLLFILVLFWGYLHFVVLKQGHEKVKDLEGKEKELFVKVQEVEALEEQKNAMVKKDTTVKNLNKLRTVDWVKKLMELTASVSNTRGWLTVIAFSTQTGTPELLLTCKVIGRDMDELAHNEETFLNSLGYKNGDRKQGPSNFWDGFIDHTPEYYCRGIDKVNKSGGWLVHEFDMELQLTPEAAKRVSLSPVSSGGGRRGH
jgi:hypothetical protein